MDVVFIYAGNYQQARQIAREENLCESQWYYIDSSERLKGLRKQELWLVGTFIDRKDYIQLMETAAIQEMNITYK